MQKRSGKVKAAKFTLGDRVYRRTLSSSKPFKNQRRREGTICGRQDVTYKNDRKHKAYWVMFDSETHPVHIEQSMLRKIEDGEAQD
jgi:hypothetical protein